LHPLVIPKAAARFKWFYNSDIPESHFNICELSLINTLPLD